MNKKIIGIMIILIAISSAMLLYVLKSKLEVALNFQIQQYGDSCPSDPNICPHSQIANINSFSYALFSIFGSLVLLGIYIVLDKSEKKLQESQIAITKTLEGIKKQENTESKFNILLSALNQDEKKLLSIIKEQDGISQNTLVLKSDMSKSKVSTILSDFESKNLVSKVKKGKINLVYLKKAL